MALNHIVKGSTNYSVVGTPTIVDGVASGFSDSNYLPISGSFSEEGDIDIVVKITTDNDLSANQYPLSWNSKNNSNGLRNQGMYIVSGGKYGLLVQDVNGTDNYQYTAPSAYALSANTTYYLRLLFTAADKSLKMGASTDGVNYTYGINKIIASNMCPMNVSNTLILGRAQPSNYYFRGSVDLNETYIKVNGQAWFGVCPVEVKHIDYGTSAVYTKVGNPTMSNGVASAFSASDYFTTPAFSPQNDWEIGLRIKTPETTRPSIETYCLGPISARSITFGLANGTPKFELYISSSGTTYDIHSATVASNILLDTWYYVKIGYTNGSYYFMTSLDNDTWTTHWTKDSENKIKTGDVLCVGNGFAVNRYWDGSIDLNQTYIKIDNKLWLYRPVTNYLIKDDKLIWCDSGMYLSGPISITDIVGSPTISGGIATGLNEYNYVQSNNDIDTSKPFELIIDFTLNSSEFTANNEYVGKLANMLMYVMKGNKKFELGLQNGGWLTSTTQMTLGGSYKIKITYDRTDVKLYVDSGSGFNLEATSNAPAFTDIGPLKIGGWGAWNGSVNLNNTSCTCGQVIEGNCPVPSGFTYGSTTTTDVGWVDIVTQAFTAVPGATVAKEES